MGIVAGVVAFLEQRPAVQPAPAGSAALLIESSEWVGVEPGAVWDAFVGEVGLWWPPAFTHDGDPSGLSLQARPGGGLRCDGYGDQMSILFVVPGRLLRSSANLGPLDGLDRDAQLEWRFSAEARGTRIHLCYRAANRHASDIAESATAVSAVLQAHVDALTNHLARRWMGSRVSPGTPGGAQNPI